MTPSLGFVKTKRLPLRDGIALAAVREVLAGFLNLAAAATDLSHGVADGGAVGPVCIEAEDANPRSCCVDGGDGDEEGEKKGEEFGLHCGMWM